MRGIDELIKENLDNKEWRNAEQKEAWITGMMDMWLIFKRDQEMAC